ncbi:NADPH:quinone reductase-like Zn-dependent oxidoreductase [Bradyrhizobium sp. LM2.7]
MTKAVRVHKVGGPEALVYESVDVPAPATGEVRIRQHAVGLNFIDVYYRTGLYKAPGLPFIAGNEAAGEVVAVGPGVTNFHPGATASPTITISAPMRASATFPGSGWSSCPTTSPTSRAPC